MWKMMLKVRTQTSPRILRKNSESTFGWMLLCIFGDDGVCVVQKSGRRERVSGTCPHSRRPKLRNMWTGSKGRSSCSTIVFSCRVSIRAVSAWTHPTTTRYPCGFAAASWWRSTSRQQASISRILMRNRRRSQKIRLIINVVRCDWPEGADEFLCVDKPMQMNQALFMLNGKSGYVLQPSIMRDDNFDPFDRHTLRGVELVTLVIEVHTEITRLLKRRSRRGHDELVFHWMINSQVISRKKKWFPERTNIRVCDVLKLCVASF